MNAALPIYLQGAIFAAFDDPQDAVDAGRESLDQWWDYPWYDAENDEVVRIELDTSGSSTQTAPRASYNLLPDSFLQFASWGLVAAVLLAMLWLLWRALRDRKPGETVEQNTSVDEDDAERIKSLPFTVARGRTDLLGEARRFYREGDYGQAIIYLFSFELVELDKRQFIRLAKGKTNRQYMRQLGRWARLRGLMEQTMVAFEDVFFGNHVLQRDRFEACWNRLDEFNSHLAEAAS